MQPIEVCQYVFMRERQAWTAALTADLFLEIIKVTVSEGTVSNTLRAKGKPNKDIADAVRKPEIQKALEEALGLPGLFKRRTHEALSELFPKTGPTSGPPTEGEYRRIDLNQKLSEPILLSKPEADAVSELARVLLEEGRGVVNWNASFQTGATFLALNLCVDERIKNSYRIIYFLRPTNREGTYTRGLRQIEQDLGANSGDLIERMGRRQALLVLLNAEAIHEEVPARSPLRELLKQAEDDHLAGEKASILTIGKASLPQLMTNKDKQISKRLARLLEIHQGHRWEFFLDQFRRFGELRGDTFRAEDAGPVIKRAHWHYEAVRERSVFPINIRLRALFATNRSNYATFDPTAGFRALTGKTAELPEDITSFINDVKAFIRCLPNWYMEGKIRVLRSVSTGKYWLTSGALDLLLSGDDDLDLGEVGDSLVKHLAHLEPAVSAVPHVVNDEEVVTFVAGIGVKAIVQDDWRDDEDGQLERAFAHYRIAERLFYLKNEDVELAAEFPYETHWGAGARFYFVSETIRHLMRTIETVDPDQDGCPLPESGFPSKPALGGKGCNPPQIVNFCFNDLFQNSLNGHETKPGARALSRKYGAYGLAAELLQLMSASGQLGEPHPALSDTFHWAYVRESAIALLGIGELDQALACFRKLQTLESAADSTEAAMDRISVDLDIALVQTIRGNADDALALTKKSEAKLADLRSVSMIRGGTARLARLTDRISARRVHLSYLENDINATLDMISGFESEKGLRDPELIHIKIAALMRSDHEDKQEEAFTLCLDNVVSFATRGEQHDALGFRISLGHILRAEGRYRTAEKTLNSVHADILRYGCSEWTYLLFLIEAGRLLLDQDRPERAYASYLRTAFLRGRARGYVREMSTANSYALKALNAARGKAERFTPRKWKAKIEILIAEDKAYREQDRPKAVGDFARDPLFGFSITEAEATMRRLSTIEGLAAESALLYNDELHNETLHY